ncbi:MAG: HAD family hydrolase [Nitrosomonas sp.]|nr:HAD family hydrolase [Nitrosomonas sp.]
MTLSAVLFDVDGTLADTERDGHRVAFNQAFRDYDLDWHWDVALYGELLTITGGKERIRHYLQNYRPEFLSQNNLDQWIAELHRTKTRHFLDLMKTGEIRLRPGVENLIQQLRANNIRIAIATTTTPENVIALLENTLGTGSPGWFDVIGAGDIVPHKKPAPDIYQWVIDQLGLPAEHCIAIEDSINGLKSALAAGIKTIVTSSEYTHSQNFSGATLILSDLAELNMEGLRKLVSAPAKTLAD